MMSGVLVTQVQCTYFSQCGDQPEIPETDQRGVCQCRSTQLTAHSKNLMEKRRFGASEAPNVFLLVHDGYRFRSRAGTQSGSSGEVSINKALWVIWCSF